MSCFAIRAKRWVLGLLLVSLLHSTAWAGVDCIADDALITVPNPVLYVTGDLTIAAWFRARSWGTNNRGRIVDKIQSNEGFMMGVDNFSPPTRQNALGGGIQGIALSQSSTWASDTVTLNTVTHGVFTRSAANAVALYVNGEPQTVSLSTFTVPLTYTTASIFKVCSGGVSVSRYFDGIIDEVYVYTRVLSPQEIRTLAQSRQRGRGPGGPLLYYPIEQCQTGDLLHGVTVQDRSANRLPLTGDDGLNDLNLTCDNATIRLSGHGVW